jgi:hypothetical protein
MTKLWLAKLNKKKEEVKCSKSTVDLFLGLCKLQP